MLRSKTETPKPAYEGGPIDELYKAYAMHESGGSLTSYNFTEADIEADAACSAFDDADEDTATKAYEINHAARRAGYFAGWKHAALFFMDIMRLLDADMDGITKREAKACKEARGDEMSLNRLCEEELNRLDAMLYMMLEAFRSDHDDIPSDMANNLYEYACVLNDVSAEIRDKLNKARSELKENP